MRFPGKDLFRWTLRGKPYFFLLLGSAVLLIFALEVL